MASYHAGQPCSLYWYGLVPASLQLVLDLFELRPLALREELVISPHSWLSSLPWPALTIDGQGTRLIERATVTQTPTLTMASAHSTTVSGPALVRLVAQAEGGVRVHEEQAAWDLPNKPDGSVALSSCEIGWSNPPSPLDSTFAEALAVEAGSWGFVHIAAHGDGSGLAQRLALPEPLRAGEALRMVWPASVLISGSHVDGFSSPAGEPQIGFAMTLLASGSRDIAACVDNVPDKWKSRIAAKIIEQIRAGPTQLDVALRRAQLDLLDQPIAAWAYMTVYKR